MSNHKMKTEDSESENESQKSQPKRCVDVTQTRVQPCSFTNSGTQTPVCIPETRCPAPVCNQDEDCHDLYCTSETCKADIPQEKSCCPPDINEENLKKKPSETEIDSKPNACCKNKRGSIGQLKQEVSDHSEINQKCRSVSALKHKGSNQSQVQKTRWDPDTSIGSVQNKNRKIEEDEGSTCPRRPVSVNEKDKPQPPLASVDLKKSGAKCTETRKCMSAKCSKNIGAENEDCPCHFPPAFSQYKCTGKISGNCSCAKYK